MKRFLFFSLLGILVVSVPLSIYAGENDNRIALINPIGGEQIAAGKVYNITYMSPGPDYVCIRISYDGGSTWKKLCDANKTNCQLGSFSWKVPNIASKNCKIQIHEVYGSRLSLASAHFSIVETVPKKIEQAEKELDKSMYEDAGGSD
jgi:hypothetical protein